jgi:hypothetical protein
MEMKSWVLVLGPFPYLKILRSSVDKLEIGPPVYHRYEENPSNV